ncbi:MAG: MFS transporter [Candidatus Nanopelagicales bacterium]
MTRELRRAWLGTALSFFLNAVGWASVVVRMPEIKHSLGASNGVLGLLLLVSVGGSLSALRPAGKWAARFGSSPIMVVAGLCGALVLPFVGWMPNAYAFVIAVFAFMFTSASMDMGQNAQAVAIEHGSERKIMGRLHGLWSIGGITGGLLGGAFAALGVSLLQQSFIMALLIIVGVLVMRPLLLPASADRHEPEAQATHTKHRYPLAFWILGLVGLCAGLGEGAAGDWGAVLLHDQWQASKFVASLPYIVFQTAMVTGRFSSDALSERLGRSVVLRWCGAITAVGLTAGLLIGDVLGVLIGWLSIGIGVSVVIPMVFSAAGALALKRYSAVIAPSQAVAVVSGVMYSAFLLGPPLIGFLADAVTLRWAMLLVSVMGLGIFFGAGVVKQVD